MRVIRFFNKILQSAITKQDLKRKKIFINSGAKFLESELEGKNNIGYKSDISQSHIGHGTYMGRYCVLNMCHIGRYCSIANGVKVIKNNHPIYYFSTHPAFHRPSSILMRKLNLNLVENEEVAEYKLIDGRFQVCVGSDVWVGEDVKILSGSTIGQGAIVAAGSIVTKDVPPYSIVAGVPAKVIKYRFSQKTIEDILKSDFWNRSIDEIESYAAIMDKPELVLNKLNNGY